MFILILSIIHFEVMSFITNISFYKKKIELVINLRLMIDILSNKLALN